MSALIYSGAISTLADFKHVTDFVLAILADKDIYISKKSLMVFHGVQFLSNVTKYSWFGVAVCQKSPPRCFLGKFCSAVMEISDVKKKDQNFILQLASEVVIWLKSVIGSALKVTFVGTAGPNSCNLCRIEVIKAMVMLTSRVVNHIGYHGVKGLHGKFS